MPKESSRLEQRVSENNEIPKIEAYQSSSEERMVVHIERSLKKFTENLQEDLGIPLDPILVREVYGLIPKDRYQKVCLEVVNELSGQDEYEAGKEYLKRLRKKQKEMTSALGIYESPE